MPKVADCPDAAALERFSLGLVTDAEADRLEPHLAACDRCGSALRQLRSEDALVLAMRDLRIPVESAQLDLVEAVTPWLKRLRPKDATQTLSGPRTDDTLDPKGGGATFDFLAPAQEPGELGRLGPYRVLHMLGAGGMGMVFLAEDPRLQRHIALKIIQPELLARADSRERFFREARAVAALEHDNVVTVHEVDEASGVPFLAMPLLRGETLEDRLRQAEGPLPVEEALQIGREIAAGLAAAHARGLVHRDIKPGNLWLESRGLGTANQEQATEPDVLVPLLLPPPRIKILDFGLAHEIQVAQTEGARPGAITGTPAYMAPEQARGQAVDARADLFSLGCVLYRVATGTPAFQAPDMIATLLSVAMDQPPPPRELNPELPPALAGLIVRLLAKSPEGRPPSAQAVVEEIEAIERQRAEAAHPRPSRRRWWLLTAAAILAAVALTVWLMPPGSPPEVPQEPGEVTFDLDEPDLRITVRRGHDGERTLNLQDGRRHALPPGEYAVRSTVAAKGRVLVPDHFQVKPGEARRVDLRLVGEIRRNAWHSQAVWAVALTPRKRELLALSASNNHTVCVWDATGDAVKFLDGHESAVRCVAFSPDGRLAATGSGDRGKRADLSIRLWDLTKLEEIVRLPDPDEWVTALAFAPDGKRLLAGGTGGAVTVWDVQTRQRTLTLKGHGQEIVHGAAFAPDGRRALTCGGDGLVILWDAERGTVLKKLEGHTGAVRCVACAPNGTEAVSVGVDGRILLWDLNTGKSRVFHQQKVAVYGVAYAPDGRRLLSGGQDKAVCLWDVATGRLVHRFQGHTDTVYSVGFSADGRRALSGSADRTVRLWELPK